MAGVDLKLVRTAVEPSAAAEPGLPHGVRQVVLGLRHVVPGLSGPVQVLDQRPAVEHVQHLAAVAHRQHRPPLVLRAIDRLPGRPHSEQPGFVDPIEPIDARLGAGFGRRAEARRFDVRAAGEHHAGENRFGRRDLAGRRGRHEDEFGRIAPGARPHRVEPRNLERPVVAPGDQDLHYAILGHLAGGELFAPPPPSFPGRPGRLRSGGPREVPECPLAARLALQYATEVQIRLVDAIRRR